MTAEERGKVLVTSRLLKATTIFQWFAGALALLALLTLGQERVAASAAIVAGVVALFYAFRIHFDVLLLEDLASDRLTTGELDAALADLGKNKGGASWEERCRGSRRLVVKFTAAVVVQLVALTIARWP